MTNIFCLKPDVNGVQITPVGVNPNVLPEGYTSLLPLQLDQKQLLFAFNKTTKLLDVYAVSDDSSMLNQFVMGSTDLELKEWDLLRAFTLGNKPYIMGYEAKGGFLGFYEVHADATLSKPYFFENQRSWPTQNFSEVTPIVIVGLVYVLCYDDKKGTVAIFSLDVIASTANGIPPLNMLNVWYHQWARGWENFSFFTLGQSNFFFKINKAKLNVNIDHILDNPALGSVEIGSYLQNLLPNAMDVALSASIPWANGEPYLATYDGVAKNLQVYRIHADCQGWTLLNATLVDDSTQMHSYRIGDNSFIILYC